MVMGTFHFFLCIYRLNESSKNIYRQELNLIEPFFNLVQLLFEFVISGFLFESFCKYMITATIKNNALSLRSEEKFENHTFLQC